MSITRRRWIAYGLMMVVVVIGFYRQHKAQEHFCRYAYGQQVYAREDAIREFQRIPYGPARDTLKIVGITIHPRKELQRNLHGRYGNSRLPEDCPQHNDPEKIPKNYDRPPPKRVTHKPAQPKSQVGSPQALKTPLRGSKPSRRPRKGPFARIEPRHKPRSQARTTPTAPSQPPIPSRSGRSPEPVRPPVTPPERNPVLDRICDSFGGLGATLPVC